jgi:hypothetical protein
MCRHQRAELHTAGLISDEEYGQLAADYSAVDRMETYDAIQAENTRLRELCGEAAEQMPACFPELIERLARAAKGEV